MGVDSKCSSVGLSLFCDLFIFIYEKKTTDVCDTEIFINPIHAELYTL